MTKNATAKDSARASRKTFHDVAGAPLHWLLGATSALIATPAWAQGAENALEALFTGAIALAVLFLAFVVGIVTLGINHAGDQRSITITLGILAGLVQAFIGGWFLLMFVIASVRGLIANGTVAFGGASTMLPIALGLLALGLYEIRVAWKARTPTF